ncbi:hypothetical protein ACFLRA_03910, partial [Bdellovibrionota bacterium]
EFIKIDTKTTPGIVRFHLRETNTSNTFISPELTAVLISAGGKVADKKQFIKPRNFVFPKETFDIEDEFDRTVPPGKYSAIFTLSDAIFDKSTFILTKKLDLTVPQGTANVN